MVLSMAVLVGWNTRRSFRRLNRGVLANVSLSEWTVLPTADSWR